jgi:hypothetical protein
MTKNRTVYDYNFYKGHPNENEFPIELMNETGIVNTTTTRTTTTDTTRSR